MKKLFIVAATLAAFTSFSAQAEETALLQMNAVFDCSPPEYALAKTVEGFVLAGSFDAPGLNKEYTINADPVMIDTGNIGRTTLRMSVAEGLEKKPEGVKNDVFDFSVKLPMGTSVPITQLKVSVEKNFAEGPSQIDCRQIGGSQ